MAIAMVLANRATRQVHSTPQPTPCNQEVRMSNEINANIKELPRFTNVATAVPMAAIVCQAASTQTATGRDDPRAGLPNTGRHCPSRFRWPARTSILRRIIVTLEKASRSRSIFPDWLVSYRKEWVRPDLIAGLTTAAV